MVAFILSYAMVLVTRVTSTAPMVLCAMSSRTLALQLMVPVLSLDCVAPVALSNGPLIARVLGHLMVLFKTFTQSLTQLVDSA